MGYIRTRSNQGGRGDGPDFSYPKSLYHVLIDASLIFVRGWNINVHL